MSETVFKCQGSNGETYTVIDRPNHEPEPVYVFRSEHIAKGSPTAMCAAPLKLVVSAYGGGGRHDQEGVQRAFGGNLFYRNDETGECFLGVWGARNTSRFRTALRGKAAIKIVEGVPPARLVWWNQNYPRPDTTAHRGIK